MTRKVSSVLLLAGALVAAGCSRPAPVALTQESAHTTVEAWAKSRSFTGEVAVEKIEPRTADPAYALAHLRFKNFRYSWKNQQREYSDTGTASFRRQKDGRWVLQKILVFQIEDGQFPGFETEIELR